jgi:hypothetical protein
MMVGRKKKRKEIEKENTAVPPTRFPNDIDKAHTPTIQ